jgi:hypothetical protein
MSQALNTCRLSVVIQQLMEIILYILQLFLDETVGILIHNVRLGHESMSLILRSNLRMLN